MFWDLFRARPLEGLLHSPVDGARSLGDGFEQDDQGDGILAGVGGALVLNARAFGSRGAVPPQLVLRFRPSDRLVWSARLSNAGMARGVSIAGARAPFDFAGLRRRLGNPDRSLQVSPAARGHWFDRPPRLYVAEERTLADEPALSPIRAAGACLSVTAVDRSLAPPDFDGGWREAARTIFVRFPGSHPAFMQALGAALPLTDLSEQRGSWSASCGDLRLAGFAVLGIERVKIAAADQRAVPAAELDDFAQRARELLARLGTLL